MQAGALSLAGRAATAAGEENLIDVFCGAFYLTLVPIRPRRRGERRSLRTFFPACLSAQGPSLSIPTHLDAFQLRF